MEGRGRRPQHAIFLQSHPSSRKLHSICWGLWCNFTQFNFFSYQILSSLLFLGATLQSIPPVFILHSKLWESVSWETWLMTNASLKDRSGDFPGGPVVKNPPANAGGHGFHLWSRKIPSATGQLGQRTTTVEPRCNNCRSPCALGRLLHKRSRCNEKPPCCN